MIRYANYFLPVALPLPLVAERVVLSWDRLVGPAPDDIGGRFWNCFKS